MGAKYLFYMKSIETHARAFLALIILGIGTVKGECAVKTCLWGRVVCFGCGVSFLVRHKFDV